VGGYLAAAYGPKRTLGYGVVLWSLFTLGTPAAASTSMLWVLLVVRAVMGLGEGVAFPCLQVLLKMWVPADKRTRALGLVYSGGVWGGSTCSTVELI
jgi:ACS family sodium-dependent inorganic phosphate cotransporter